MILALMLIVAIALWIMSVTVKKMDDWQIPSIIAVVIILFIWMIYWFAVSDDAYNVCHYHVVEESRELINVGKVNVPDDRWVIYVNQDNSLSSKMKNEKNFKNDFTKYFKKELRYIEDDKTVAYFLIKYNVRWGWVVPWPTRNRWAILAQVVGPNGEGRVDELYSYKNN
jgi:hypothetical protein